MPAAKHIVITGVSRGLGRALVDEFIADGHIVAGCCRSDESARELAERYPAPHSFDVCDVAVESQVGAWANKVLGLHGPPDLVVNNAALINAPATLWEVPPAEFSRVVDVNIKGTYYVIRHFVPAMIERGIGTIVNFSSGWGRSTAPEVAPYCATKWAIEGLSQALAAELPPDMTCVALNPGIIWTEMLESCFGASAFSYPRPDAWAKKAAPMLLGLAPRHNGQPLTVPG